MDVQIKWSNQAGWLVEVEIEPDRKEWMPPAPGDEAEWRGGSLSLGNLARNAWTYHAPIAVRKPNADGYDTVWPAQVRVLQEPSGRCLGSGLDTLREGGLQSGPGDVCALCHARFPWGTTRIGERPNERAAQTEIAPEHDWNGVRV